MIPRRLKLDFSAVPLHWARVKEFSVDLNASSPIASQSEPYLNTVMVRISERLTGRDEPLRRELGVFVKQESNHCSLHSKFNSELYKRGYRKLADIEMSLKADFKDLLDKRSLEFNAAYCAGFENLALFLCKYIFFRAQPHFAGSEQTMADLFLWHYAEEFEHRTVAHDAFAAVSGNYFLRVYGAIYAFFHLVGYKARMKKAMMEIDRSSMTAAEVVESRRREKALDRELALYVLPRMLQVLQPYYDPRRTKVPPIVQTALDRYAIAAD